MKDFINSKITGKVKPLVEKKIIKLNQTDKGQGHIIPNFEKVLKLGLGSLLQEVEELLIKNPNNLFYQASKITLTASQRHILRYARLAMSTMRMERGSYSMQPRLWQLLFDL